MAQVNPSPSDAAKSAAAADKPPPVTITGRVTPSTLQGVQAGRVVVAPGSAVQRDPELTEAHKQLRAFVAQVMQRIERLLAEAGEARAAQTAQLSEQFDALAQVRPALENLRQRIEALAGQQKTLQDQRHAVVDGAIGELRQSLTSIVAAGEELRRVVDQVASQQAGRLDAIERTAAGWRDVAALVEGLPEALTSQFAPRLDALAAADDRLRDQVESLRDHVTHTTTAAGQRADAAAAAMTDHVNAVGDKLSTRVELLGAQIGDRLDASDARADAVTAAVNDLSSRADKLDRAADRIADMEQTVSALADRVDAAQRVHHDSIARRLDASDAAARELAHAQRQMHDASLDQVRRGSADLRADVAAVRRVAAVTLVVALAAAGIAAAALLKLLGAW